MANVQYKTQVGWDTDLIDLGFLGIEGNELCISANKKSAGAPAVTAGVFSPGAQVTNIASGVVYYNTGSTAAPIWSTGGGGFSLPITTNLAGGIVATYDQTNNFLGLGLTCSGQTFDTGTGGVNMLASLNTTPFGGAKNTTFIGYLTPPGGPGANANIQARYDDVTDESQVRINTNNLGGALAEIEIKAVPGFSSIEFTFGVGGNYFFPNTSPAVGEVMGYTAPNQLGWVTPTGGISIGDAIGGATGNRVLFEDLTGNLQESSSFLYDVGSQIFLVGFTGAGSAKLYINEAAGQYWIGDATGSANKNKITIDDSNGRIFIGKDPFGNPTASYLNIDPLNSLIDLVNPFQMTRVGAPGGAGNGTYVDVQDGTNAIYNNADQYRVRNNAGSKIAFIIDTANDLFVLGDTANVGNYTRLFIDDVTSLIDARTFGAFRVSNTAGTQSWLEVSVSSYVKLGDLNSAGNDTVLTVDDTAQRITVSKPFKLHGYTVATLPAGATGDNVYVTDALAPTWHATVVGGGAVVTPVFYDGANWIVI